MIPAGFFIMGSGILVVGSWVGWDLDYYTIFVAGSWSAWTKLIILKGRMNPGGSHPKPKIRARILGGDGGRLGVLPYKNNLVLLLRQCQGKWKLKSDCSPEHMLERIWSMYVFLPCLLLLSFATSSWWVPLNVSCFMLVCLSLLFCWNTLILSLAFLSRDFICVGCSFSISLPLSVCLYGCVFLFLSYLLCLPVCLPLQSGPCGTHFWGASEAQGTFGTVMREIRTGAGNKN